MNMNNKLFALIFGLALSLAATLGAQAQLPVTIDDFVSSRATGVPPITSGAQTLRRTGNNIVGGACQVDFGVEPLAIPGLPARASLLDIPRPGPLMVDSGLGSTVGVMLTYGLDRRGNANPLNLNLLGPGFGLVRIEFVASTLELNYLVQVFDGDGNNALLSGTTSTANRAAPFTADFPFADFSAGAPNPINWNDIDLISVQLNTGNATGGQDFAVRSIVAIPTPLP